MKLSTAILKASESETDKIIRIGERWSVHRHVVEDVDSEKVPAISLYHYSTHMATAAASYGDPRYWVLIVARIGHGSVSDQTGMNTFFRVLQLPYRYDRAGGAGIRRVD